jgi:dCMP deaminase
MMNEKWIQRYLDLADHIAQWSHDKTKIGAVAVKTKRVLATGFNGFPERVSDDPKRYMDREFKLKHVVHAEANCIYNSARAGVSLQGAYLFVTGLPVCSECAKAIISSGISRVYMRYKPRPMGEWAESFETTKNMFHETGVLFHCKEV